MAETIESFVQKLQEEGVDAGREQAQKLLDEAGAKAEGIVAEAQRRAEEIIADAKAQAETDLKQGRDELALACRDVLLRLRATVVSTLEAVLKSSSQDKLRDEEFFVRLLHDVAVQYAEKDSIGESPVVISVDEEMLEAATRWAMQEMTSNGGDDWRSRIDLKGRLKTAGFEYSATNGTIEVTPESVSAVLSEMISPRLREIVQARQGSEEQ
jgi:V/A-type H+-transporting ATPase subunit E